MNNLISCEICSTFIPFSQYIEHCEECYIRTSITNRNMNHSNQNGNTLVNIMTEILNQNNRATITMIPIDIEQLQPQNNNAFAMNTLIEDSNGGSVDVPVHNLEECYEGMYGNDLSICSICLDESTPNEKVFVRTTCNHTFCKECIDRWFAMRHKCPVCSNDFNSLPNQ